MPPEGESMLPILFAQGWKYERENQTQLVTARGIKSLAVIGELIARVSHALMLHFLLAFRESGEIVSLCGKVKNKSQVHAFTSFLSSEPTGGHSRSDFAMPPYGWLADPAREAELRS